MKWRKICRVFCPDNNYDWMRTHASNPVAEYLGDGLFRIYFSSRDAQNRSSIAFLEIGIREPERILRLSDAPLISPGPAGAFDDSGVSMACVVTVEDRRHVYYLGWNLGVTVPWRNAIGLAVGAKDEDRVERFSPAPVFDRNPLDPYSLSYPWILREAGKWRMWYGSNLSWGKSQRDMEHVIKYAESADGFGWKPTGKIAIAGTGANEYAISRPCVVRDDGLYRMWYSRRGEVYRIGYAESPDGMDWTRKDDTAGIGPSDEGWDSGSVAYASIFDHQGSRYMLYNGADYGKTGFGLAVLES